MATSEDATQIFDHVYHHPVRADWVSSAQQMRSYVAYAGRTGIVHYTPFLIKQVAAGLLHLALRFVRHTTSWGDPDTIYRPSLLSPLFLSQHTLNGRSGFVFCRTTPQYEEKGGGLSHGAAFEPHKPLDDSQIWLLLPSFISLFTCAYVLFGGLLTNTMSPFLYITCSDSGLSGRILSIPFTRTSYGYD